ncbi:MAG TPA: hypothetical protein VN616_12290 [Puia sp.]|nr:hypothetical protein [Puia sp.]
MKKIVMPIEAAHYPGECLAIAAGLNQLSPVMLTAAVVPDLDYASLWTVPGGFVTAEHLAELSSDEIAAIDRNNHRIEAFCSEHRIPCIIRRDQFDFALQEIRKESRFADLLLISSRHFFENISADQPNAYMHEILHHSGSTVLLLPDEPVLPDELVFAYDGSDASLRAIRQFVYLFPELCSRRVTIVHLSRNKGEPIPDAAFLKEWLTGHFREIELLELAMDKKEFFASWMAGRAHPWLIAGSYGRSDWSQLLSESFAAEAIRHPGYPIFMAHG